MQNPLFHVGQQEITKILKEEGYVKGFKLIDDQLQGIIRIYLKYNNKNQSVINNLQRISKPSRRVYVKKDKIPRVLGGMGIAILTTSKGIMADRAVRQAQLGGEVLCYVW